MQLRGRTNKTSRESIQKGTTTGAGGSRSCLQVKAQDACCTEALVQTSPAHADVFSDRLAPPRLSIQREHNQSCFHRNHFWLNLAHLLTCTAKNLLLFRATTAGSEEAIPTRYLTTPRTKHAMAARRHIRVPELNTPVN